MFRLTLCNKLIKQNKVQPYGQLGKISSKSHGEDLLKLQNQITSVVNIVYGGIYFQSMFKVTTVPAVVGQTHLKYQLQWHK